MSNQKVLLFVGTVADEDYLHRLAGLTAGEQVAWKFLLKTPDTVAEIEHRCKAAGVTGIVCSNEVFLEKLLRVQPDFIPPNNKRGLTLDDYQGSWLETPREKIPVVILNPLINLITVPHATPAAKRFIQKLSRPSEFFVATDFTWEVATEGSIDGIYQRWLQRGLLISIDIETPTNTVDLPTGIDAETKPVSNHPDKRINCVGYCCYFADGHTECLVIPFTDLYWHGWVKRFNLLPQPKVMQNGLYDNLYFLRWACPVFNWLYDTQHLFHSLYSEYPKRLDFITAFALRKTRYWKDDGKSGSLQDYYRYNAKDCWATLNSFLALLFYIHQHRSSYALSNYVEEFPLVFPCITCEVEGCKADQERLAVARAQELQKVRMKEEQLRRMLRSPHFNARSPVQVSALFKVLGVGHLKGTDKPNMLKAQAAHPLNNRILSLVVEVREGKKLVGTYYGQHKLFNGRWHYKINPAGTDTGRLASSESSYWTGLQWQNIPTGKDFKQCVISDSGWLLGEIDKAQSEARCVGYQSGETKLIAAVEGPNDFHAYNASAFFGLPYDTIYSNEKKKTLNKEIRDLSKRTNHGANYNMGDGVMLDTMGPKNVSRAKVLLRLPGPWSLKKVCGYLLERFSATYPKVKGLYYDSIIKEVELTGRLVSPLGWVRIFFSKPRSSKHALNSAVAHPSQNLSVGIVNREFYNIWRSQIYGAFYPTSYASAGSAVDASILKNNVRIKAQIHDSNFFQYREEHPTIPQWIADNIMNTRVMVKGADGVTREMFIPSDIAAGKNRWSELKD